MYICYTIPMNKNGFTSVAFLFVIATLVAIAGYLVFSEKASAPTFFETVAPQDQEINSVPQVATTSAPLSATSTSATKLLQDCPETWYDNRMPGIIEPGQPRPTAQYFIYKGERHELAEFDMAWIQANCHLTPSVVY